MHVSIISCGSFAGRLLSGIGSDFLVKRHHLSRFWCLVASSAIFAAAQVAGLTISNPYNLWVLSSVSGIGYGVLFGVYPALVADAFGVHGLALNWGFMTLAPAVFGNVFNIWYGTVFDANSTQSPAGDLVCDKGLECYQNAYWLSAASSIIGILVSLGTVYRDGKRMHAERESSNRRDD
jgi:MFS family permease